jgi:hypothetical protein
VRVGATIAVLAGCALLAGTGHALQYPDDLPAAVRPAKDVSLQAGADLAALAFATFLGVAGYVLLAVRRRLP